MNFQKSAEEGGQKKEMYWNGNLKNL